MADWRSELCRTLGAAPNANNLKALDLWARSEAVPVEYHNPLGARVFLFSEHRFSALDEWQHFPSIGAATIYYARVIEDESMAGVNVALHERSTLFSLWLAIHGSRWRPATFQSGRYPVLLYRQGISPTTGLAPPVEPLSKQAHDIFVAWHNLSHELRRHAPKQLATARHWARRMHSAVR